MVKPSDGDMLVFSTALPPLPWINLVPKLGGCWIKHAYLSHNVSMAYLLVESSRISSRMKWRVNSFLACQVCSAVIISKNTQATQQS